MKKIIFALLLGAISLSANAYDTYNVPGGTFDYLFNFYEIGEDLGVDIGGGISSISSDNVYHEYHEPIFASAINWSKVIKGNTLSPVTYSILGLNADNPEDNYNASAASLYANVAESPYKVTYVNARINGYTVTSSPNDEDFPTDGMILVGLGISPQHSGWAQFTGFHPLYHGELPDLCAVITHEIMHSLGLNNYAAAFYANEGDKTEYFSKEAGDSLGIYDQKLRIYTGDMTQSYNPSLEIVPAEGMAIGKDKAFDIYNYSPYFVGEETLKVLAGEDNPDDAKTAIIASGGLVNYSAYYSDNHIDFPKVYGLPIHPSDDEKDDENPELDLSHIELHNSYMSHQGFRNWLMPMEAELAVLKDLGYNIPLRKYFGKSYYLSNATLKELDFTTGYSEWDGTSYTTAPSTATQGVGVHIYGNKYKINQASDILTVGEGAIGARIEGADNIYTVKSGHVIQANGKENLGLAVTWGQNHTVNVENGASVSATGEDGIAVSFDFGSNIFGIYMDAKGSYINYNAQLGMDKNPDEDIQHALVDNFNVAGTIHGSNAAIYLSDNAHVKNINILNGAQITGDIVSEWNSVKSGLNARVQRFDGEDWVYVNPENEDEIYFTNLNIDNAFSGTINGSINGKNGIYNTLKLNNSGDVSVAGEKIYVNTINNTGNINISNAEISAQNGEITGIGSINVSSDGNLSLSPEITDIENTVKLGTNSNLSTLNEKLTTVSVNELNAGANASISFDLGDTYNITTAMGSAKINQIRVDDDTIKEIEDGDNYRLFLEGSDILDLSASPDANVYYNGNKYSISQSGANPELLQVNLTATGTELADAVGDSTTANYIVTEDALTKDIGTIQGETFTISGNDIDVNGNSGLVIDGNINTNGTTIKTGIAGASDANITLQNNAGLFVNAEDKDIVLGETGEVALAINNSEVKLDAVNNTIEVQGSIAGTGVNTSNNMILTGDEISIGDVENVTINSDAQTINLYGTSTNNIMNMSGTIFNVENDSYLAFDGSNTLNMNNAALNLANNKTTDIKLAGMNVVSANALAIDIDLKNLEADRFVFADDSKLSLGTDSGFIIQNANLLNSNEAFTDEQYYIPFVSAAYNNQALIDGVEFRERNLITPIFKYNLKYTEDDTQGGFLFSRGATKNYNSYNPAVTVSPVAAQLGGFLSQLNSYEQAFQNLDMKMLMTREERQALKMANSYASEVQPKVFSPTYLPEKNSAGWFRPYASFEKVGLKNGPKVENVMYGSYFGGDSQMFETKNGWDYQYSVYAGYNGSHQNYQGNSIYQNGGNLGATAIWYKNDFFTALTANVGASVADASTMYGSEDFPMLMTGVASKTGYNWELAKGKFIIQPSYLMSYTFVNTFDYTNAAGVRIKSDPLNAINIAPGLKFIGNLKHGWQPYIGMQMVWNIMDKTDFKANNVALPDMSVKPYFQYGVGVQKRWGERFTGFFQTMIRNGGRNGIALSLGFRWALGK